MAISTQFAELTHALASGAANIGGVRLTQTLTALEDLTDAELRQAGPVYVEKIEAELARLNLALEPFLRAQRRGETARTLGRYDKFQPGAPRRRRVQFARNAVISSPRLGDE